MNIADLIMKWIHITAAGCLVGVAVVMLWGLLPALAGGATGLDLPLKRCKTLVHSALGLLLLTGIYNFVKVLDNPALKASSTYQQVLGAKMLIFLILFALGILIFRRGGPAPDNKSARGQATWLAVGAVVVFLLSAALNLMRVQILSAPNDSMAPVAAPAMPAR